MSTKPVPRDEPEEVIGSMTYDLVKSLLFPPLWFYPHESVATRFVKSWWFYAVLAVVSVPLFWQKIQAGEVWVVLTFPVAHVVILGALAAILAASKIAVWPEFLVAPAWLPSTETLLLLFIAIFIVGIVQMIRETYGIDDDELGAPMSRVDQRSDGAGKLPKLERDVCSLLIGETGGGKSSAVKLLAYQYDYTGETATIAHDLKSDFWDFYRENTPLDVERVGIDDSTVTWNMFLDIENERQFFELAKGVMGQGEPGNPFHRGATQVLAGSMIYLYRKGQEADRMPDHADLIKFLNQDRETLHEVLKEDSLPGASSIDPETGGSRNTYLTMKEHIQETFVGDFAESGDFSFREYIENPEGRVITISTKADEIETTGPFFRLMIDLGIKYGMVSDTEVNYIMDEVDSLPYLRQLSMLAKAGRGEGIRGIIGIQTVGQLEAVYQENLSGVTGNCPQGLYFGPGDRETTDYILSELGEDRETVTSTTESESGSGLDKHRSSSMTEREVERAPVTSGELKRFDSGDCVVKTRTDWWIGRVELLENVRDDLDDDGIGIGAQFETETLPEPKKEKDQLSTS